MATAVVPGKTVVAPVVVSTWFVTVPNAANALVDVARIATPAVTVAARVATADRRNRLVAVVTLASIREVVVARWLSPKAQSWIAPPIPEQTCSDRTLQVSRLRKPDAPPTTYVVSWFGVPKRTFVRFSNLEPTDS